MCLCIISFKRSSRKCILLIRTSEFTFLFSLFPPRDRRRCHSRVPWEWTSERCYLVSRFNQHSTCVNKFHNSRLVSLGLRLSGMQEQSSSEECIRNVRLINPANARATPDSSDSRMQHQCSTYRSHNRLTNPSNATASPGSSLHQQCQSHRPTHDMTHNHPSFYNSSAQLNLLRSFTVLSCSALASTFATVESSLTVSLSSVIVLNETFLVLNFSSRSLPSTFVSWLYLFALFLIPFSSIPLSDRPDDGEPG